MIATPAAFAPRRGRAVPSSTGAGRRRPMMRRDTWPVVTRVRRGTNFIRIHTRFRDSTPLLARLAPVPDSYAGAARQPRATARPPSGGTHTHTTYTKPKVSRPSPAAPSSRLSASTRCAPSSSPPPATPPLAKKGKRPPRTCAAPNDRMQAHAHPPLPRALWRVSSHSHAQQQLGPCTTRSMPRNLEEAASRS